MTKRDGSYAAITIAASAAPMLLPLPPGVDVGAMVTAGLGGHYLHWYFDGTRLPSLPDIRCVSGEWRWMDFADRALLKKIRDDLRLSPLSSRDLVSKAQHDMLERARPIGVPARFRREAITAIETCPRKLPKSGSLNYAPFIDRMKALAKPISVLGLALQPAVSAAFLDMRDRVGIPLELDGEPENGVTGVERMIQGMTDGPAYDVALLPNSVFLLSRASRSRADLAGEYSVALPLYVQQQHVIRPRLTGSEEGLLGVDGIRYFIGSSADEQVRMWHERMRFAPKEHPYDVGTNLEIAGLEGNQAVIVWDPIQRFALTYGKFVSVGAYRYWMSLYLRREAFKDFDRQAFLFAFLNSWAHCRENPEYAFGLVCGDRVLRSRFRESLRLQMGRA